MPRLTREQSRQETRARLLDAARETFALHGFAGASVDRIAAHAGYSKGAVYSNFESKEALFLQLLRDHMAEEIAQLRELLDGARTAEQILRALNRRYSSLEDKTLWALLSTEFQLQAGRNPEFAEAFAELYRDQRKAIAGLLKLLAKKAGAPAPASPLEAAAGLIALVHGLAMQRAADPKSVPSNVAGRAIEVFLKALLA